MPNFHSYEEVLNTLDLVIRLGMDAPVLNTADPLVYPVLTRDRQAMADLVRTTLGPLLHTRGGAQTSLDTLTTYFDTGCNAAETARRLSSASAPSPTASNASTNSPTPTPPTPPPLRPPDSCHRSTPAQLARTQPLTQNTVPGTNTTPIRQQRPTRSSTPSRRSARPATPPSPRSPPTSPAPSLPT